MPLENVVETDVLVIGGATAGCFAAIKAKELGLDVTIVDKAYAGKSGSSIMASGFWGVFNPEWGHDLETCINTVNVGGDYLNDREWTGIIFKDSYSTYESLVSWGVEFPAEPEKRKDWYSKEIVGEDTPPGRASLNPPYSPIPLRHRKITPVLRRQAEKVGVKVMDRIMITDLITQEGRVVGSIGFPMGSYALYIFKAKAVVLSAGGNSFKPPGYHTSMLGGDAEAMAYRVGAEITGKEFQETHHFNLAKHPAWKGNGELYPAFWYFTDSEGTPLGPTGGMNNMVFPVHEGKGPLLWRLDEATPREIQKMEMYIRKRANPVEVERVGLIPDGGGKWPVIGGSAAGTSLPQTGGIWPTSKKCATSVPGLYVAGDCCCTRCWGAHFLVFPGGRAPAAVTGNRAGEGAAEYALQAAKPVVDKKELARLKERMYTAAERKTGFDANWVTQLLQNTVMPYYVLYVKSGERLQAALTFVEFLRDHLVPKIVAKDAHELRLAHETENMVLNAEMILRASLFRTESRGFHYREDYPRREDPAWLAWTKAKKDDEGRMKVSKEPVPKEWWPDLSKPYEQRYIAGFPESQKITRQDFVAREFPKYP